MMDFSLVGCVCVCVYGLGVILVLEKGRTTIKLNPFSQADILTDILWYEAEARLLRAH